MSAKKYTLVLIRNSSGEILLGLKKRGFGKGKWNGFGGKLEVGETLEDAAVREVKEECNLVIEKRNLKKVAVLTFEFEELEQKLMEVHVFSTFYFSGEIQESDEMMPKWFNLEEIPFDNMFADDKIWFPLFLNGKQFTGSFVFKNLDIMLAHNIVMSTFK